MRISVNVVLCRSECNALERFEDSLSPLTGSEWNLVNKKRLFNDALDALLWIQRFIGVLEGDLHSLPQFLDLISIQG